MLAGALCVTAPDLVSGYSRHPLAVLQGQGQTSAYLTHTTTAKASVPAATTVCAVVQSLSGFFWSLHPTSGSPVIDPMRVHLFFPLLGYVVGQLSDNSGPACVKSGCTGAFQYQPALVDPSKVNQCQTCTTGTNYRIDNIVANSAHTACINCGSGQAQSDGTCQCYSGATKNSDGSCSCGPGVQLTANGFPGCGACIDTKLAKPASNGVGCVCPSGYTMDAKGICRCGSGSNLYGPYTQNGQSVCSCQTTSQPDANGVCGCPSGATMDASGNCSCAKNAISTFTSSGALASCSCGSGISMDSSSGKCTCTQFGSQQYDAPTVNGVPTCTCPTNAIVQNDVCVCFPGMIMDTTGTCVCPSGSTYVNQLFKPCQCNTGLISSKDASGALVCSCPANQVLGSDGTCGCQPTATAGKDSNGDLTCSCPTVDAASGVPMGMDSSGSCVCYQSAFNPPSLAVISAGKTTCSCGKYTDTTVKGGQTCKCLAGMTMDSSGNCDCPQQGQEVANLYFGGCKCKSNLVSNTDSTGALTCSCSKGQKFDNTGTCVCPSGQQVDPATNACTCSLPNTLELKTSSGTVICTPCGGGVISADGQSCECSNGNTNLYNGACPCLGNTITVQTGSLAGTCGCPAGSILSTSGSSEFPARSAPVMISSAATSTLTHSVPVQIATHVVLLDKRIPPGLHANVRATPFSSPTRAVNAQKTLRWTPRRRFRNASVHLEGCSTPKESVSCRPLQNRARSAGRQGTAPM